MNLHLIIRFPSQSKNISLPSNQPESALTSLYLLAITSPVLPLQKYLLEETTPEGFPRHFAPVPRSIRSIYVLLEINFNFKISATLEWRLVN